MRHSPPAWTVAQAREVYNTARWGGGYFEIDDAGKVRVRSPRHPDHPGVDLAALAEDLRVRGYGPPVLARFSHILHDRVDTLCGPSPPPSPSWIIVAAIPPSIRSRSTSNDGWRAKSSATAVAGSDWKRAASRN